HTSRCHSHCNCKIDVGICCRGGPPCPPVLECTVGPDLGVRAQPGMMTMIKNILSTTTLLTTLALTACGGAHSDETDPQSTTNITPQNTALLLRLAQLQQSVQYAEDLSAITRLQKSYGYYLDKGLWTDLADYFADNARANYPAGV